MTRFALVTEDGRTICTARGVDGFFVERDPDPRRVHTFRLLGCDAAGRPGDLELRVLDRAGNPLGAYGVTAPTLARSGADLEVTGLLPAPPHPKAGAIWERWHAGPPTVPNLWAEYPTDGREAWLEVVRLHHRWVAHAGDAPAGRTVELDGTHLIDRPGFHCAMGEAVNGPGGYFGATLDALRDCLRGGFGAAVPFDLVWHASDVARTSLGEYFGEIRAVLERGTVRVITR